MIHQTNIFANAVVVKIYHELQIAQILGTYINQLKVPVPISLANR